MKNLKSGLLSLKISLPRSIVQVNYLNVDKVKLNWPERVLNVGWFNSYHNHTHLKMARNITGNLHISVCSLVFGEEVLKDT